MMINKRLIQMVPESKAAIRGQVLFQWGSLTANIVILFTFSFILEDREKRIPDKHPVALEIYNPRGQFYTKMISTQGMNGFYTFDVPTLATDPTGLWNAYIKV